MESSLRRIIDNQLDIIRTQDEVIKTLTADLDLSREELAKSNAAKERLKELVEMTERAEEETNEQLIAMEARLVQLTEFLETHGLQPPSP